MLARADSTVNSHNLTSTAWKGIRHFGHPENLDSCMVQGPTLLRLRSQVGSLQGHVESGLRTRLLLVQAWQLVAAGCWPYCSSCSAGVHPVSMRPGAIWLLARLSGGGLPNSKLLAAYLAPRHDVLLAARCKAVAGEHAAFCPAAAAHHLDMPRSSACTVHCVDVLLHCFCIPCRAGADQPQCDRSETHHCVSANEYGSPRHQQAYGPMQPARPGAAQYTKV
jgi:hypothetical protein